MLAKVNIKIIRFAGSSLFNTIFTRVLTRLYSRDPTQYHTYVNGITYVAHETRGALLYR